MAKQQDDPQAAEPAAEQLPQAAEFPRTLAETADAIQQRRDDLVRAERTVGEAQARVNQIRNEIDALNGLRAAYGQPTL